MKDKIYCGEKDPLPKNYDRYGNMEECIENNQIRRYGKYKVDKKIMQNKDKINKKNKYTEKDRGKAYMKIAMLKGNYSKLKREYDAEIINKKKGKKYSNESIKKYEKDMKKIKKEISDAYKIYEKINKIVRGGCSCFLIKGGKLKASLLKELFKNSTKKQQVDVDNYKIDKELSTPWVQIYHNNIDNWTIVLHRGSADYYDAFVDAQLAIHYKNNERFREAERIQKLAEKKYNPKRMSVVGSSLGGYLGQEYGKNAYEIITSGKPTTPADLFLKNTPPDNQYDVRTQTDIISFLKPLMPHKNDITVKSIDPLHPVKSHQGHHTMQALMNEKGDDFMIGKGKNIFYMEGGQDYRKLKVRELKKIIFQLRKNPILSVVDRKKYNVSKRRKADLISMISDLKKIQNN